jgi:hypothetical protein
MRALRFVFLVMGVWPVSHAFGKSQTYSLLEFTGTLFTGSANSFNGMTGIGGSLQSFVTWGPLTLGFGTQGGASTGKLSYEETLYDSQVYWGEAVTSLSIAPLGMSRITPQIGCDGFGGFHMINEVERSYSNTADQVTGYQYGYAPFLAATLFWGKNATSGGLRGKLSYRISKFDYQSHKMDFGGIQGSVGVLW